MKAQNKVISSFGSAFIKQDEQLYQDIIECGKIIAEKGYTLYSGGYSGSMEAISKGAKSAGGKTIGVTLKKVNTSPNAFIDEEFIAQNLMERISHLINSANAFIIFKGGTGTLLEISSALEMMNKKVMDEKLMIFYNDYWKNVIETLENDQIELKMLIERNVRFIDQPNDLSYIL